MTNSVLLKGSEKSTVNGINVAGYLTAESGVGAAARGYVKALKYLGLDVALNNFEVAVQSRKEDKTFTAFATNNPFPINLVCVNADQVNAFIQQYGLDYFKDKYNIAVWWWETSEFPEDWFESFNNFDEIWVGSSHIQKSISAVSPVPVVLVPPVVSADASSSNRTRFNLDKDEFLFLCVFDFLSSFERKNPIATIRAFRKAFGPSEPVRLVLKGINGEKHREHLDALRQEIQDAKITVLDEYLSTEDNQALINSCDAYISLHRAEGLGLPIAEAMLHRRPVVATGWSGNLDFNSIANSFLVSYKLVANTVAVGPYKVADTWAEPDIEHATLQMRSLYTDAQKREQLIERAFHDASRYFSEETIGQIIQIRLTSIAAFNRPSTSSESDVQTCHLDPLTEQRLQIIETGASSDEDATPKSRLRKGMMALVARSGYLNTIYTALFRKLFVDSSKAQTQIELIDARTRRAVADADHRIADLEKKIANLQSERKS